MRLTTYNIWNSEINYSKRIDLLVCVLREEMSDFIALQEVKDESIVIKLNKELGFPFYYWKKYHDCEEGLAILSKYEIKNIWTNWDDNTDVHNSGIMFAEVMYKEKIIGITNVHLDYKHAHNREIEIV